ncbi:hypothetical protein Hanom_Chr03g00210331 [Helianthus anomalus]
MDSSSIDSQRQLLSEQLNSFGFIEGESVEDVIRRHGTIVLRLSWGHTITLQRKQKM